MVVNIFTLEVAVEDISTEGEAKGVQTAHEKTPPRRSWLDSTLLFWWRRAEREVPTRIWFPERPARGIQGSHGTRLRWPTECIRDSHGHSLRRIGSLQEAHEGKGKQGRRLRFREEAVRVALHLAASREHGLKKASFSMDPLLTSWSTCAVFKVAWRTPKPTNRCCRGSWRSGRNTSASIIGKWRTL